MQVFKTRIKATVLRISITIRLHSSSYLFNIIPKNGRITVFDVFNFILSCKLSFNNKISKKYEVLIII